MYNIAAWTPREASPPALSLNAGERALGVRTNRTLCDVRSRGGPSDATWASILRTLLYLLRAMRCVTSTSRAGKSSACQLETEVPNALLFAPVRLLLGIRPLSSMRRDTSSKRSRCQGPTLCFSSI
ncbi:hypothetical protein PsYK624_134330 [Phanerochaete sordida]|uniref:Uncharacterized protein n=1 Tax=Phanerochaete sordida TaxID=48140 RepID=A0A9P3GL13_9APHY|nr:hypothetical protein PsYK624_134330 [Phanerochaete sordida]